MWEHSFNKNNTFDESFHVDKNTQKNVPTMQVISEIFYKSHEGLGAEIVRLPYQAKDGCDPMSMIIILPNWEQSLSDIKKKLNNVTLESLYPTDTSEIHLHLPKFMIKTKLSLNEHLQKMGIKDAFTSKANFRGITKRNKISISKVIQQAFIEVNEDGTKAAAATYMGAVVLSANGGPLDIHVNRPFLFLLATERVILFTGYVNDPTPK
ncbi:serpin B3-like [Aphidius gifuensis]|nr:serpin B3-like [Aphidius gifuensis]